MSYECEDCNYTTEKKGLFARHRRKHTKEKPSFKCEICGVCMSLKANLKRHLEMHKGIKQVFKKSKCGICEKVMSCCTIQRHIRAVHLREKCFACNICGKRYLYRFNCQEHEWAHDNHRPYQCTVCGDTFPHSASLRNHSFNKHKYI
jgi:KRAB domain-containing zinc finger protein